MSLDGIVMSDFHLGGRNVLAKDLVSFLKNLPNTKRLILNGDIFDSYDMSRFKSTHWEVLRLLRNLPVNVSVDWIIGNHEICSHRLQTLIGIPIHKELVIKSGSKRILIVHGNSYKHIQVGESITKEIANCYMSFPRSNRYSKRRQKRIRVSSDGIAAAAVADAISRNFDAVICGHTHTPCEWTIHGVRYVNTGSWVVNKNVLSGTWAAIRDGHVSLRCEIS